MHAISYLSPVPQQYSGAFLPQNQRGYPDSISGQLTLNEAVDYLEHELSRIGANKATIYSHYEELKNPRLRKQLRNDSSVVLEFSLNGNDYRMMAGYWQLIDHNLYALHMIIRQLHGCVKWNIAPFEQLLAPFDISNSNNVTKPQEVKGGQASSSSPAITNWMQALGLGPTATSGDISAVYHRRAKLCETEEAMVELNTLVDAARKAVL